MSKNWKDNVVINLEETGVISRKLTVELSGEIASELLNNAARIVGKEAIVNGFRQGKAPIGMIKIQYPTYVQKEAFKQFYEFLEEMLQKNDKLKDLQILYVGSPENMPQSIQENVGFNVTMGIELTPEIELPDYSNYGVSALKDPEIPEGALEKMILAKKDRFGTFEELKDGITAGTGDLLNVSFTSDLTIADDADDVTKRLASNDNTWFALTEPEQIPGIVAAMTGASLGSEISFASNYPEDWHEEFLKGKTVNYKVKVLGGQHRGGIISDEELATKLEFENKDAMLEDFRKQILKEEESSILAKIVDNIQDELLKGTSDFPLPDSLMKKAKENEFTLLLQGKSDDEKKKMLNERDQYDEEITKKATESVRKQLIISKIAKNEKIEITNQDVYDELAHISQYTGIEIGKLVNVLQQSDRMTDLSIEILIGKTLYQLAEKLMNAHKSSSADIAE